MALLDLNLEISHISGLFRHIPPAYGSAFPRVAFEDIAIQTVSLH